MNLPGRPRIDALSKRAPIRVLFLLNSLCIGGSERKTVRIANKLQSDGFEVHLAFLNPPETLLAAIDKDVHVHNLQRNSKLSFTSAWKLASLIRAHSISLVFVLNLHPLIYAAAAQITSLGLNTQFVALVNKSEFLGTDERRTRFVFRHLLNRADRVVFGCKAQMDSWIKKFRLVERKCDYIYNGVDIAHFDVEFLQKPADSLRKSLNIDAGDLVIGCVGQLRPEKRHIDLLSAVEKLSGKIKGVRVLLVGDGPMRASIESFVEDKGLDEVVCLLGELDDPRPALAAIDIFVLPSIAVETFSNSALEAMAMRRPVILSDIGGANEMINHGKSGLIYPKGDTTQLTNCLMRLCDSQSERIAMGKVARADVERRFSSHRMYTDYAALINEVINQ